MSSQVHLAIATLDSLDEVARELSVATGWSFDTGELNGAKIYKARPSLLGTNAFLELDLQSDYGDDGYMLFTQYQLDITIFGPKIDQFIVGSYLYKTLQDRGHYRIMLTDDLQYLLASYEPGNASQWRIVDEELWRERGAAAVLDHSLDQWCSEEAARDAAWILFLDELAALGAPLGTEADWRGAWHIEGGKRIYRTDEQAKAISSFMEGWSHAGFSETERLQEGRPRSSPVVSRQKWVHEIREPGCVGTTWLYLRTHRDGQLSIHVQPSEEDLLREFATPDDAHSSLKAKGYEPRESPDQVMSGVAPLRLGLAVVVLSSLLACGGGGPGNSSGGGSGGGVAGGPGGGGGGTISTVAISISPSSVSIPAGATQLFTASVTGSSNIGVSWAVAQGSSGGSINANGLYTAPSTTGAYTVVVIGAWRYARLFTVCGAF